MAVTLAGSAFHARAPETGNARSPSEDRRVAGTTTSVLEVERSRGRDSISDTSLKSSEKYSGPMPCRQRYTMMQSLNVTRSGREFWTQRTLRIGTSQFSIIFNVYSHWTVKQMKTELVRRNASTRGCRKADLIEQYV